MVWCPHCRTFTEVAELADALACLCRRHEKIKVKLDDAIDEVLERLRREQRKRVSWGDPPTYGVTSSEMYRALDRAIIEDMFERLEEEKRVASNIEEAAKRLPWRN